MTSQHLQVAIVGGGIAGLWLLNRLRSSGYDASLFEKTALGSEQTFASQGMIHGGLKYALGGFTTAASETIASMPSIWRDCIAGRGQIDLTGVDILSDDYYLFSDAALTSKITAFFASKSLKGRITSLQTEQYPAAFQNPAFRGNLYRLQDLVVNTPKLIQHLAASHQPHIYQASPEVQVSNGKITGLQIGATNITADRYIFCAGRGNEALLENTQLANIKMQLRPLQQVFVKGQLPKIFAHAVSLKSAAKPRLTISSHPSSDGQTVWNLGGNLAEQGVGKDPESLIQAAKTEVSQLLPWIDTSAANWLTLNIDRAEPAEENAARPDTPFVAQSDNAMVCWPTKLTLTPLMADEVCKKLGLAPANKPSESLQLPPAIIAKTPWEQAFAK